MKNRIGPPVKGDDFFDREQESARIWRYLDGGNLLLLAPRRVGKTSLMKRLVDTAEEHDFYALYVTVEGAVDEADFVLRLIRAVTELKKETANSLLDPVESSPLLPFLKRVKKVGIAGASVELTEQGRLNWSDSAIALGQTLSQVDSPWLLAVDELPLFVLKLLKADKSGERAANFLHSLRELRQNQPELRWLLAGSIGLDTVTSRYNLGDTINDLRMMGLGPFDNPTADQFLLKLATSYKITIPPQVRSYAIERLEWPLPYYLQLLFSELLEIAMESKKTLNRVAVDQAFDQLLDPAHKNYFDYWKQRLHEELGAPDDSFAIMLLSAICRDPGGVELPILQGVLAQRVSDPDERDQRLRYLLDVLENDGYLVQSESCYRFRLPLLREYWLRRIAQ